MVTGISLLFLFFSKNNEMSRLYLTQLGFTGYFFHHRKKIVPAIPSFVYTGAALFHEPAIR